MGRLDNTPQPVREAIAVALMVAAVTATAASSLHQPLFILGGFILFLVFYIWRIHPQVKAAYSEEAQRAYDQQYADDETYQPILDRFKQDGNEQALFEQYAAWRQGPHDNQVRMRFLQEAILSLIDAGCIYRVEELMADLQQLAQAEGLEERFAAYRADCDRRIADIAQGRL
ncbi:MAG TPA: hypothetical protein DCP91_06680 [Eggerthellaceae bacterium]|nr:hypothetical protein [Eggerthellaceae bacterium]